MTDDRPEQHASRPAAGTEPGTGPGAAPGAGPGPGPDGVPGPGTGADGGSRTGVWLIGARGSVATTAVAGCAAVTAGMHPPTGLITETDAFAGCRATALPPLESLVFGGHDTVSCPLPKRAEMLAAGGVLPHGLPTAVHAELAAADAEVRTGGPLPDDPRDEEALIAALAADITHFTRSNGLARTVVVNVASTEPAPDERAPAGPPGGTDERGGPAEPGGPGGRGGKLPPSSCYAAAALRAGCGYVNFTPSTGLHHPRLSAEAARSGLPYAGRDGKTGQTLLRSVLAPMFAQRALTVRSWSGTNLLGGGDGAALADPGAAAAKNAGKARVLADTLGHLPDGQLHIDDVPAMGDWKTAWDHVAVDGFLGSRTVLQTTWQGCDSALAAPLVLDLARIVAAAHATGIRGPVDGLGFYFKDPDSGPADLPGQWQALLALAARLEEATR